MCYDLEKESTNIPSATSTQSRHGQLTEQHTVAKFLVSANFLISLSMIPMIPQMFVNFPTNLNGLDARNFH